MGDAFALQLVYLFLPLAALLGGFALILRSQYRARAGASRIGPASTIAAAAATVGFLVWAVMAIFGARSSTAGIGFLFLPGQALAVAAGAWLVVWALLTLLCFVPAIRRRLAAARPGIARVALALVLLGGGAGAAADYGARRAQLEAAASPESSAERLAAIASQAMSENKFDLLVKIAGNTAAGRPLLDRIHAYCRSLPTVGNTPQCYSVYMAMAANMAVGDDILGRLAEEAEVTIRSTVAYNAAAPVAVLEVLSRDPEPGVRRAVTTNRALPRTVLERLARDPEPRVRAGAEAMLKRRGTD